MVRASGLSRVALLFLLFPLCRQEEEDCNNFARLMHEKPGNVTITGIVDGRAGENCSVTAEFGVGEAAAAVWTVTALERANYLPGIKIGMAIFDACGSSKAASEAFAEGIILESCRRNNISNIGFIASPEVDSRLSSLSHKLERTVTRVEHILDIGGVLSIVSELLTNLHWTTVNRVVGESRDLLEGFGRKMAEEGICVYDEVLVTDRFAVNNEVLDPEEVPVEGSHGIPVIVVLCSSREITALFDEMTPGMRELRARWIVVPTDFTLNTPLDNLPRRVFSVVPLVDKTERLLQFLTDGEMQKDHMNHREATRSPLFVKIAVAILELLRPLKEFQERHCPNESSSCPELEKFVRDLRSGQATLQGVRSVKVTPERILAAMNALKMDVTESEAFLYIASLIRGEERTEDAAIFQVFDSRTRVIRPVLLIVNERLFNERAVRRKRTDPRRVFKLSVSDIEKMRREGAKRAEAEAEAGENEFAGLDRHPCVDALGGGDDGNLTKWCGVCQNLVRFRGRVAEATTVTPRVEAEEAEREEGAVEAAFAWRFRIWVAINASVASIGAICTVAVTAFILLRMCKGDILEGSPYFSFVILASVLLLYAATLPYSVEQTLDDSDVSFLCHLRVMSPVIAYSILFSAILSRSVMLAFSERDSGLMNHVNGCLQSVLCFFMCGVQIALAVQFWVYNLLERGTDCEDIHVGRRFIALLVYSFFLLTLLVLVAPFTFRSKRNYSEGMFFAFATLLIVTVWSVWLSFYHVLPVEDRDAAVAFGLTGTATSVLLAVFIPRTYLMATAIVRDQITNTLPSLAYMNSSNISDINYRSNQALYDSVTVACRSPKLTFSNPRIYSVQVSNSAPASPNFGNDLVAQNDDADYVLNRRKTFIEIPRAATPDTTYESYESPELTGKITKF